jgi:hypothetical protein
VRAALPVDVGEDLCDRDIGLGRDAGVEVDGGEKARERRVAPDGDPVLLRYALDRGGDLAMSLGHDARRLVGVALVGEGDGQRLLRVVTGLGAHAGRVSRGVVNASLSPREEIAACFTGL